MNTRQRQDGLTALEILASVAIGAVLILSLMGTVGQALDLQTQTRERALLLEDARFAMDRMVNALRRSPRLLLPLPDNPATAWREHVREQTVPASPPEPDSLLASAVLAMTLAQTVDLDGDGWADANNDRDFLDLNANLVRDAGEPERIDEDPDQDATNDAQSGIAGIDDDGDGAVDEEDAKDDDEDQDNDEDSVNSIDDDNDGAVDEDTKHDRNNDGEAGVKGVDDDRDGDVDEGHKEDDDEDGIENEDWFDPVVFRLAGGDLIERHPLPYDANGDFAVDGLDFVESVIAENVTHFRVERVPAAAGGTVTVDITLTLASGAGDTVSLHTIVRVGDEA